jgi:hypothetical protein
MVMIFPKFARQLNEDEMLTEICSKDMKNQIAILDYSSKISVLLNHLKTFVLFYLVPLYTMALIMVAVTFFYFYFFKCPYKRRCQF